MAGALVPVLESSPAGTTLNLNVPNVALGELRGLRHGRLGRGGTIRSAVQDTGDDKTPVPHVALPPGQTGTLRLDLTAPGTSTRVHPDTDAGLLARDYASLTALVGVREAGGEADDVLDDALEALYGVAGVTPGQDLDADSLPEPTL
jgi:5'-nucleotidase